MALTVRITAPEKRSDRTKSAILRAARERLAAQGYDRTTIRAVAADAGIDPSMVMRYFGSKAQLFDAALDIDLRLPDLTGVPLDQLPEDARSARSSIGGRTTRPAMPCWFCCVPR